MRVLLKRRVDPSHPSIEELVCCLLFSLLRIHGRSLSALIRCFPCHCHHREVTECGVDLLHVDVDVHRQFLIERFELERRFVLHAKKL